MESRVASGGSSTVASQAHRCRAADYPPHSQRRARTVQHSGDQRRHAIEQQEDREQAQQSPKEKGASRPRSRSPVPPGDRLACNQFPLLIAAHRDAPCALSSESFKALQNSSSALTNCRGLKIKNTWPPGK